MRLVIYYPHNRLFKKDGNEFSARALDCTRFWSAAGHNVASIAMPKGNDAIKRAHVLSVLSTIPNDTVDRIAVFCHGTSTWCDLGFTTATAQPLIDELVRVTTSGARIGLFCCLTGKDPINGLAAKIMTSIRGAGYVMAHTTSGHTTRNPNKRIFIVDGKPLDLSPRLYREKLKTVNGPFELLDKVNPWEA